VPPGSLGQIARWARLKEAGTEARDVIVLELAKLTPDLSPARYAKTIAEKYKGEVNEAVTLGNLPAVEVRSQHDTEEMSPRQTRIAAHQGHLWILSFWSDGRGGLALKTISAMAKTVEWQPFADPVEHLALAAKPVSLLQGKFRVKLPEIARPSPVDDPKTSEAYGIRHFARDLTVFIFKAQVPADNQTPDFATAKTRFAKHIGEKFPGLSTLVWEDFDLKDAQGSFLAPVVLKEEAGKPTFREYHYLLLTRNKELLVLSSAVSTWESESLPKYRGLIKEIVRSIELPE
jgi:hypothetical protein